MKLAWILWLASILPPQAADLLCPQHHPLPRRPATSRCAASEAVAEVALRRQDSGRWGDSMCDVVTARKRFAPPWSRRGRA